MKSKEELLKELSIYENALKNSKDDIGKAILEFEIACVKKDLLFFHKYLIKEIDV